VFITRKDPSKGPILNAEVNSVRVALHRAIDGLEDPSILSFGGIIPANGKVLIKCRDEFTRL